MRYCFDARHLAEGRRRSHRSTSCFVAICAKSERSLKSLDDNTVTIDQLFPESRKPLSAQRFGNVFVGAAGLASQGWRAGDERWHEDVVAGEQRLCLHLFENAAKAYWQEKRQQMAVPQGSRKGIDDEILRVISQSLGDVWRAVATYGEVGRGGKSGGNWEVTGDGNLRPALTWR